MDLLLVRHTRLVDVQGSRSAATCGTLYLNGALFCFTLEDDDRLARGEAKVPGDTAIPAGKYQVVLTFSERFQRVLPLLLDVPQFTGVRIHAGSTTADTQGCVLVGGSLWTDPVVPLRASRATLESLMARLRASTKGGKVWMTVTSLGPTAEPLA